MGQKTFSDIASDKSSVNISGASFVSGDDTEESISSGNPGERKEALSPELAFVTEFMGGYQGGHRGGNEDYGGLAGGNGTNAYSAGSISNLLFNALPRSKNLKIRRAYVHAEKDDLLQSLVETLTDFTGTGFSFQAKPPSSLDRTSGNPDTEEGYKKNQKESSEFQQRLDEISIAIDAPKLISDLVRDWYICDSMVLYWRTKDGTNLLIRDGNVTNETSIDSSVIDEDPLGIKGIIDIAVLNPGDVDWDNSIGTDVMFVNIPDALRTKINDALMQGRPNGLTIEDVYLTLMKDGIPKRWIDAVRDGRSTVQLLKENGDHWLVRTRARNYQGLSNPSMFSIFLDLEMRNIMKEGDASAALMMKHFIMLIKQGESIENGPLAGNTRNWLKLSDAQALLKRFSISSRAFLAAVNHTTQVEWIYPPKEMFDGAKYVEPEKRIFNWAGVTRILSTGEGGKYSGGFIGLKRTMGKIVKAREEVQAIMLRFFMHETVSPNIPTPKGYTVNTRFDSNILKEPRQLLDEIKFLAEQYWIDPRSALKELERDADAIKDSTMKSRDEADNLEVWTQILSPTEKDQLKANVDAAKAKVSGDPGGRPPNDGTTKTEATRNQAPVAQRTENS